MFDIDDLRSEGIAKVEATIERCRAGNMTGDRAARAAVVLLAEAQTIVSRHLRDAFKFDPNDFPAYVDAFPTLPAFTGSGDIAQSVTEGVKWHLLRTMENELSDLILAQHGERRLPELLDGLETAISGTLDLITQFRGYRLERAMQACRDNADEEALGELRDELGRQAEELRSLIHRLDIADPPTADYAGRGRRLLLEARDLVDLTLKHGSLSDFRAETSDATVSP